MTLNDRQLDRRLAALTREAEPGSDHWPAIERRIGTRRRWGLPVAASAAAALVLAVAALRVLGPGPGSQPSGAADLQAVVSAEARAMQASAPEQNAAIRARSPEALMRAWSDNQRAIEEIESALARDPGNPLLLEFLAEARLRQARLINSSLTLPTQARMTL